MDGKAHRRLNTIHLLLVGATYEVALHNSRVSKRTLRLWISRFNELGIDGLIYRPGCGRRRKLEPHMISELILPLVDDPSLAAHRADLPPPYSPDFNPIERFWQHLRSHQLAGFITKDGEALEEKIFQAIRSLLQTPRNHPLRLPHPF